MTKESLENGGTSAPKYNHQCLHPDGQCGCGPSWSPSWLQCLRWPPVLIVYMWLASVPVFMNSAYFGAILPALERQFGLSSAQSALLSSLQHLSSTVVVVFICYFAERTSRPKVFGLAVVLIALGNLCTALPHFLSEPLDTEALLSGQRISGSSANISRTQNLCEIKDSPAIDTDTGTCDEEPVGFRGLIWWAVIGQLLFGIGQAAVYPIVIPFLDDIAGRYRPRFLVYFSIFCTVIIAGPAFGYFLGTVALKYHVDFERIPQDKLPVSLSQRDPRWIGAWWVGFVVVGIYLLFAAIPSLFIPKDPSVNVRERDDYKCLRDGDENITETDVDKHLTDGSRIVDDKEPTSSGGRSAIFFKDSFWTQTKDFIAIIKRILGRPVLILYMLYFVVEIACVSIFATFVVKYFRLQFAISGTRAALINGAVLVPAAILGLNISAYVCRRFKFTLKECAAYIVVNNIITIVLLIVTTFIGCQNQPVAGVNYNYATSITGTDCNTNCDCNSNIFSPVCGADNVTYISPCFAGCQTKYLDNNTHGSYYDCTCVQDVSSPPASEFGTATPGLCERDDNCDTTILYIVVMLFGLLTFCHFQDNAPANVILLGNCEPEIRSTVLGLNKFFFSILGFFPTPVYFGAIINTTCVLWQYTCGERGACWLYDIVKLRYALFGLNIALRILQLPCAIGIMLTVKETLGKKTANSSQKNSTNEKESDLAMESTKIDK